MNRLRIEAVSSRAFFNEEQMRTVLKCAAILCSIDSKTQRGIACSDVNLWVVLDWGEDTFTPAKSKGKMIKTWNCINTPFQPIEDLFFSFSKFLQIGSFEFFTSRFRFSTQNSSLLKFQSSQISVFSNFSLFTNLHNPAAIFTCDDDKFEL